MAIFNSFVTIEFYHPIITKNYKKILSNSLPKFRKFIKIYKKKNIWRIFFQKDNYDKIKNEFFFQISKFLKENCMEKNIYEISKKFLREKNIGLKNYYSKIKNQIDLEVKSSEYNLKQSCQKINKDFSKVEKQNEEKFLLNEEIFLEGSI